jgi:glycosyltransferase involved in cell wall biosynthesis
MNQKKQLVIFASAANHYQFYIDMIKHLGPRFDQVLLIGYGYVLETISLKGEYNVKTRVRKRGDNFLKILSELKKTFSPHTVIIFDEIYESLRSLVIAFIVLNLKIKIYLVVHDVNKWFMVPTKFIFQRWPVFLARKFITCCVSGIIVVSPNLKGYMQKLSLYPKDVFVLPFSVYSGEYMVETGGGHNGLVVAVPGSVHQNRRDYDAVLNAFESIWDSGRKDLVLKIIGNTRDDEYGSHIARRIGSIKEKYGEDVIKTWDRRLSSQEFVGEILSSDIIVSNLSVYFTEERDGNAEVYGFSKESGTSYLMLTYAKPGIVPYNYIDMPVLATQTLKYRNADHLKAIILDILDNKIDIMTLKRNSRLSSEAFLKDAQAYFDGFMRAALNGMK